MTQKVIRKVEAIEKGTEMLDEALDIETLLDQKQYVDMLIRLLLNRE